MNKQTTKCLSALILAATFGAAQADIVLVAGLTSETLNKAQLSNLYLGRTFDRKLLDLPEGSETRDSFYRGAVDRDPTQVKAQWARVVFSGKGLAPLVLKDAELVKKAVISDPKTIGYIDKSQLDGSVKVLLTLPN